MHTSRKLVVALVIAITWALALTATQAAPRKRPPAIELTSTEEAAAQAELDAAKRAGKLARAKLKAAKAKGRAAKARARAKAAEQRAVDAAWMVVCIDERTGPDGGIDEEDAQAVCADELAARRNPVGSYLSSKAVR